ncbi:MAG: PIN domain-containing protein [Deltaproteobacteria bacterium]|nr:PIN domain-containing protein [Deltaproteobacteria bacterium]
MADLVFLDTSAYLCILLGEESASELSHWLRDKALCCSALLWIETERNLVHMTRQKLLSAEDYQSAYTQVKQDVELFLSQEINLGLCLSGEFPAVKIPRSNDLVHLRSARWFFRHRNLKAFVSLDKDQKQAAAELGLPVLDSFA